MKLDIKSAPDVGSDFRGYRGPDSEARPPKGPIRPPARGATRVGSKRKAQSRDPGEGRRRFFLPPRPPQGETKAVSWGIPLTVEVKFELKWRFFT